jgi:hypothetical protein
VAPGETADEARVRACTSLPWQVDQPVASERAFALTRFAAKDAAHRHGYCQSGLSGRNAAGR